MIKPALLASLLASIIGLGVAPAGAQTLFKVGVTTRQFVPAEPYEWRGDAKHTLATMIWYPADLGAEEKPRLLGPPGNPLFDGGQAATNAALAPTPAKFPLIVLSHGTGGTGGSLAWLGTALARAGYVAAAVDHPGNNAIDGYTVEGFTLWWERARDLGAVIDGMLADPTFMTRIDAQRIGAAGFSLGGYTVIATRRGHHVAGAFLGILRLGAGRRFMSAAARVRRSARQGQGTGRQRRGVPRCARRGQPLLSRRAGARGVRDGASARPGLPARKPRTN